MNYKCNGYKPDPINKIYIPFDRSKISGGSANSSDDVDLRPFSPPTRHDQGQTESCVGNGTIRALEIRRIEKFGINNHIALSVMDLYFGARDEMDPKQSTLDNGTNISLAMDVLRRFGVCRDITWPWDPNKINIPSPIIATREAFLNKINGHFKIDSTGNQLIDDIILNLKNKNPVVFGMNVGQEFQSYNINSDPLSKLTNSQGGHCTVLVGYVGGLFIGENSWGGKTDISLGWGFDGFYFIDPNFLVSVGSDFWVMQNDFDIFWQK